MSYVSLLFESGISFVLVKPCMLSTNSVNLGFFCFINFPILPPPPGDSGLSPVQAIQANRSSSRPRRHYHPFCTLASSVSFANSLRRCQGGLKSDFFFNNIIWKLKYHLKGGIRVIMVCVYWGGGGWLMYSK